MIRCDRCDKPCDAETIHTTERHGFSFGPYEEFDDEVSECCGAEVYDDGKVDEDDAHAE